ncbi:hypothetical protein D1007_19539 [Hordeum vulgare]|nr:hypothetical protein D1007_19539 [Hordeum vulgare]
MSVEPDEDECLPVWVYRTSVPHDGENGRWMPPTEERQDAKTLLLAIKQSEHHVKEMKNIVNINYVDKEAFMNVDIIDKYEEVLIYLESPSYDEVVEETRTRLKWVDASDQVELVGIYNVGSAHKCRMKTMPIRSNLHWAAYKEVVASSTIKSLELFASKMEGPLFQVDLNQNLVDDVEHKVEVQANEYPNYEFAGSAPINDGHDSQEEYERQHNNVGDVEAQVTWILTLSISVLVWMTWLMKAR